MATSTFICLIATCCPSKKFTDTRMEDGAGWEQIFLQVATIWSNYLARPFVMSAAYITMAFIYLAGTIQLQTHPSGRSHQKITRLSSVHLNLANSLHSITHGTTTGSPSLQVTGYPTMPLPSRTYVMAPPSTSLRNLSLGHQGTIWQDSMILSLSKIILLTVASWLPPQWKFFSYINRPSHGVW